MSTASGPIRSAALLGPGTWTRQGPATLVVRETGWVVLVPGTRKEVIESAWMLLGQRTLAETFLDDLTREAGPHSARTLSAILFGIHGGTSLTIGVRGSTPVAVHTADGAELVVGTDEGPVALRTIDAVRRVAFGDLPSEDPVGTLRVATGITRVRGFVQVAVDPADLGEEDRAALAAQVATFGRSIENPEAAKRPSVGAAPKPVPSVARPAMTPVRRPATVTRRPGEVPASIDRGAAPPRATKAAASCGGPNVFDGLFSAAPAARASASTPETTPVVTSTSETAASSRPTPDTAETGDPSTASRPSSVPDTLVAPIDQDEGLALLAPHTETAPLEDADGLESSGAYDDLFGRTIHRSVEDAAVRRGAEDESEGAGHGQPRAADVSPGHPCSEESSGPEDGRRSLPSAAPRSTPDSPAAVDTGVIDWVPGAGRIAPEIARADARRAAPPPRREPVSRPTGRLLHQSPTAPVRTRQSGRVVVLTGLVCRNGHANSAERSRCRACEAPLDGPARRVARPPLGAIELSTGEHFVLDRPAIVGRRPRASRADGRQAPQLITVPSPQQDVSRSHLELRLEGWHVVAIDLGSTNGTTLQREGADRLWLRPQDGIVLHDGDRLDLGDDVRLRLRERS
ncbi:FHA domain-containing protein [Brachybacterium alimentarium]|uniref:FHA domain-containing protein n=1 Tax=Brachybacterium alimentarium TaxID=47845 RepID=UPI003FD5ABC9